MAKLFVLSGDDVGRTYEVVGDAVTLGRGTEADLQVKGRSVSRKHARLERGPEGWRLVDLGSANGIRVGGMKVGEADLIDGESFFLGDVELRFRAEDEPSTPVSAVEAKAETTFLPPAVPIDPEPEPEPAFEPGPEPQADDDFDLEGEWDEDAPLEVAPIRSAPQSAAPSAPRSDAAKKSAAKRASAMGAGAGSSAGAGGVRSTSAGRKVLQYNKVENRQGMLAADLGQQTAGVRWLLYLMVVAMFVALAYGAYTLTSSSKRASADLEVVE